MGRLREAEVDLAWRQRRLLVTDLAPYPPPSQSIFRPQAGGRYERSRIPHLESGIVADYRLEGVCIFLGLGLLLHLKAGGWQALATPKAALFFIGGFLLSYFLVGEINYRIIIARAHLKVLITA